MARRTRPAAERFWEKVERGADGECWLWTGTRGGHKAHYGTFFLRGRTAYAHRAAWELTHGPIPPGIQVCHNCPDGDTPLCVNPRHLYLGTQRDNARDARLKGQVLRGTRSTPFRRRATPQAEARPGSAKPCAVRGARNGNARLTAPTVRAIKRLILSGQTTYTDIAREYGIARTTVGAIARGRLWGWLPAYEDDPSSA